MRDATYDLLPPLPPLRFHLRALRVPGLLFPLARLVLLRLRVLALALALVRVLGAGGGGGGVRLLRLLLLCQVRP